MVQPTPKFENPPVSAEKRELFPEEEKNTFVAFFSIFVLQLHKLLGSTSFCQFWICNRFSMTNRFRGYLLRLAFIILCGVHHPTSCIWWSHILNHTQKQFEQARKTLWQVPSARENLCRVLDQIMLEVKETTRLNTTKLQMEWTFFEAICYKLVVLA